MEHKESAEQKIFVRWFRLQYPHHRKRIAMMGNERKCNPYMGVILNEMGRLTGVPDLFIAVPTKLHPGLFIEMKYGKNKCTESQLEVHEDLREVGYRVDVCWSADEAIAVVKDYFN